MYNTFSLRRLHHDARPRTG